MTWIGGVALPWYWFLYSGALRARARRTGCRCTLLPIWSTMLFVDAGDCPSLCSNDRRNSS